MMRSLYTWGKLNLKRIYNVLAIAMAMLLVVGTGAVSATLPAEWDWRDVNGTNYVTPVKDQGLYFMCGSCWAHAAMAAIESNILIEHGIETDLSEQYFASACWGIGDCEGGYVYDVLRYARNVGIMSEECVPQSANMSCYRCDCLEADEWLIDTYELISSDTIAMKTQIMEHGPIAATFPPIVPGGGEHAMSIIGWTDENMWICKDSRGVKPYTYGYVHRSFSIQLHDIMAVYGSYQKPCARYDINNDCEMSITEMGAALDDWNAGIITMTELGEVLDCWNLGQYCNT